MKLHELKPNEGARRNRTRKGRGPSSGLGKTAGRGENGQNSRSGGGVGPGFEGGQMPLSRRLPKRGFSNAPFKKAYMGVNVDALNKFESNAEVTPEMLLQKKIIKKIGDGIKILGNGKLEKPLNVKAHAFSRSAVKKIEDAGGKAEVI